MRKYKEFGLNTITDLKVFILFLLDNIKYPIAESTIMNIVQDNVDDISFDYEDCLNELVKSEHLLFDEYEGIKYYMISDKGRMVSTELYDTLDAGFRERSLRTAIRYISFENTGASIKARIEDGDGGRHKITLEVRDRFGEVMKTSLTVNSLDEAEAIKANFEAKPSAVYRGILFAATGKIEFLT